MRITWESIIVQLRRLLIRQYLIIQDLQRTPIDVQPSCDDILMWLELIKTIHPLAPNHLLIYLLPHQFPTGAVPQGGGHAPLAWGPGVKGTKWQVIWKLHDLYH